MQSEIFQGFICYNFDDYGLLIMKNANMLFTYYSGPSCAV